MQSQHMQKKESAHNPSLVENIFGWVCTLFILSAFLLNSLSLISATSSAYIFLNVVGGIGVGFIAYRYRNYQSVFINIVWIIIAVIALIKAYL